MKMVLPYARGVAADHANYVRRCYAVCVAVLMLTYDEAGQ